MFRRRPRTHVSTTATTTTATTTTTTTTTTTFDATCVWSLVVIARVTPTSRDDEAKGRPTRASIEHLVGILKYSRGCGGTTFGHVESQSSCPHFQSKGERHQNVSKYEPCVRIFAKTTRVCGRPTLIACKLLPFALLFAILLVQVCR